MQMIPTIIVAVIMYIIVVIMKEIAIIMVNVEVNIDVETIIVHKAFHPTLIAVATITLLVRRYI